MSKFVYQELHTKNPDAAKKFYGQVFGWEFEDTQMPQGTYTFIKADGEGIGGLLQMKGSAHWVGYIGVASVKRAVNKATKRGGKVVVPFRKVPGHGAFAILTDPAGARFAVWESSSKPGAAKKATKKRVAKKAVKKRVAKKATKKRVAKKAVKKMATRRVVKKRIAKKAVKKMATRRVVKKRVAKKAVAKKAVKKRVTQKRVVKKATPKKAVKKRGTKRRVVRAIVKKGAKRRVAKKRS